MDFMESVITLLADIKTLVLNSTLRNQVAHSSQRTQIQTRHAKSLLLIHISGLLESIGGALNQQRSEATPTSRQKCQSSTKDRAASLCARARVCVCVCVRM